ncbi:Antitoxin HigA-1 [Methylobacterium adhaesivum]|uniref:HigA family addiction module antitoxin n=1 Tax=Methylobacterium adhaesivum TaxID=333297 RepID=A0ABT8BK43_9HYPH|nr:HigA family addiction module antitoxin [Methylobacterium adhaesivum]MDN3592486.1 HigA family addiction module antitoxin [Methylobacterium adhaesivum]GJD32828.1 Antitoxin HigA-1 [Methylobacterium adhaesivum]
MSTEYETDTVLPPMHPGEVLREEFMIPLNLTAYAIAKACRVPRTRIERIAREEIGITADTALRLGRFFGMDPQVWVNLQSRFDLLMARNVMGAEVDAIQPLEREAA